MINKLIGVLKYHQDHKLIKSEIIGFEDFDLITAAEVLCTWVGNLHVIAEFLFEHKGYDMWVRDVVMEASSKLNARETYTHYDELYTQNAGRLGMIVSKRKVNSEKDGISCEDGTLCFYLDFVIQSYTSGTIETYSMTIVLAEDITLLD